MKNLIKALFFVVIITGFGSCSKELDKLDNPNLVTDPPINGLLVTATYNTAYNTFRVGNSVSYYTQYLASSTKGSDIDVYNEVDFSNTWTALYNTMMNIKQMENKSITEEAWHHQGVAKILLAVNLNMIVNNFGDAPYSEALQGQELLVPAFDDQATLHATSISLLDEGLALLARTDNKMVLDGPSDVIHGGNVAAWTKTAHALKARFLNQLSRKTSYNANTILSEVALAYTVNADDAALTAFDGRSPWNAVSYNNTVNVLDGWMSSYYIDALDGTIHGIQDPRLPIIASLTKFGDYRGTRNGDGRIGTGTNKEESYLWIDGYYSKGSAPLWLVTYAEMKFIEAEAAFRANDKAKAYAAYLAGIDAHMMKLGVPVAEKNAYINHASVSVGEANISLALIAKEKYVAMILNPEAWVDARRFDYPYKDFQLPVGASMNTFIRRFAYPTVEISRNGENVPEISGLDERLYFDIP